MSYCRFTDKRPGMHCSESINSYCIGLKCKIYRECVLEINQDRINNRIDKINEIVNEINRVNSISSKVKKYKDGDEDKLGDEIGYY
ncbi:hypothetical protein K413DRAFT_4609 [Clostridium sp. ASBs410]|nr:hypothetical protein K413DRAFT_4609 [Clostridium sp. ASBs410]